MDKYQRGKIYTIRCHNDDTMIYVGSTVELLSKRMAGHRASSKLDRYKNILLYQAIKDDWNVWYIELFENYPCNSKEELRKREGEVIREVATLNKQIAGRNCKEWYKDNKAIHLKNSKEYYENNKAEIEEQKKIYREINKAEIAEHKKIYYENNKAKIAEKRKIIYEENKDMILKKMMEVVKCEYCGCNSSKCNLQRHQRTQKCQAYQK